MPDFSIALTGLEANTVALNSIGNNLANLNTTAFKKQNTTFEDLFYQNIGISGSNDQLQVGVGTRVSSTTSDFGQGSLTATTTQTDLALSGNGFFVVDNGNVQSLTRAGNFQLDTSGNLITTSGENVMGYGATSAGTVNLNAGLVPLQIPVSETQAAKATSNLNITTTLDSTASVGTAYPATVKVFDSTGQSYTATVTYTKASSTSWNYAITLPAGASAAAPVNNTGTLTFDSNGNLVSPATNVTGVSFPQLADGASDLNLTFDVLNTAGQPIISQTAGASAQGATIQDGYASGSYTGFTVDGSGVLSATFSNGNTQTVGQVAVATVINQDGLIRTGDNDFSATQASGEVSIGVANAGGRASIEGETLELSNVDISAEFSNLIVAQRAFEANSKTVTTFDSVTQDAIAMVR